MKDDLAVGLDLFLQIGVGDVQHRGQRQLRLGQAARRRKWQRRQLVLSIELVDLFVDRIVGWVLDDEFRRVGRRVRLAEARTVNLG
jgi:hypothetical protein